jgi:hypothetical protein
MHILAFSGPESHNAKIRSASFVGCAGRRKANRSGQMAPVLAACLPLGRRLLDPSMSPPPDLSWPLASVAPRGRGPRTRIVQVAPAWQRH